MLQWPVCGAGIAPRVGVTDLRGLPGVRDKDFKYVESLKLNVAALVDQPECEES